MIQNRNVATGQTSDPAFARTRAKKSEMHIESSETQSGRSKRLYVYFSCCYRSYIFSALQGAKIRSSYITFAHKEKKRLEALVETSAAEILVREKEVARLRGLAPRSLEF